MRTIRLVDAKCQVGNDRVNDKNKGVNNIKLNAQNALHVHLLDKVWTERRTTSAPPFLQIAIGPCGLASHALINLHHSTSTDHRHALNIMMQQVTEF